MKVYTLQETTPQKLSSFSINYKEKLNPTQLEAVEKTEGPTLVIAGAGSGKTMTLVYRVIRLMEMGVRPEQVLLLTFTKKAASEMIGRAKTALDKRCEKVSGGTFHSFANLLLRKYAPHVGLKQNFTILDRSDAEDLVNLIRTELGCAERGKRFPYKKAILNILSKAVNKSCSVETVLAAEYPQFLEYITAIEQIGKVYTHYKKTRSLVDFDDLLIHLQTLLQENDDIRRSISSYYKYIMIDEYQDTNKVQAEIGCLLASCHQNIMVVGDDSQSIYSFRGANFNNIIEFPERFPDTRIITLEQNYRSSQPILDLTNEIIRHAEKKYPKSLFTKKNSGNKPVYVEAGSEHYQSQFVAQKVLELREEGLPLNKIAVLFRAGWHSNDLEVELTSRNIPFVKHGGFKFIETAHVKDLVAHLRVIVNPQDSVSWHRILLLIEGIGAKTAGSIMKEIVDNQAGLEFLSPANKKKKKYSEGLESLQKNLEGITPLSINPAEQIKQLISYYTPLLQKTYDDAPQRINDLHSLSKIALRYDSLETFLAELSLEPVEFSQSDTETKSEDEEKLILSTIHSAKGLEWHTVFLISLIDGYLPSARSLNSLEEIEEERRLFYVAATRAKENLFLIKPDIEFSARAYYSGGGYGFSKISRFLGEGELLQKYMDHWVVK